MNAETYFERIGLEWPKDVVLDSELLRKIQYAHCTTVPYENLDMIRGVPTSLEPGALFDKIVVRRQGGLCFELNGSLGNLLDALGYKVAHLAARYLRGEEAIPMRRHRVLLVEAPDGLWLLDAGIGERCQREPLKLVENVEQPQFGENYRFRKDPFLGWVLMDFHKGTWRDFYSFTEEPQLTADFIALNFYCEKHPASPFNKREMFSLKTAEGRFTLDGNVYKEFSSAGVRVSTLTPDEMADAYAQFGLTL
ncbi:MAG: arylamine N-acetyltransferase family protein [Kiritimatiellia bacterium]|jgi:arylamine N-acetyltransferase